MTDVLTREIVEHTLVAMQQARPARYPDCPIMVKGHWIWTDDQSFLNKWWEGFWEAVDNDTWREYIS